MHFVLGVAQPQPRFGVAVIPFGGLAKKCRGGTGVGGADGTDSGKGAGVAGGGSLVGGLAGVLGGGGSGTGVAGGGSLVGGLAGVLCGGASTGAG